jgi:hypothetical protein
MDFARDEGEASGHARYNMSRLGSEMEKLGKKRRETNEEVFNEAKDKKGKGSGTKDACYHKVKSRYSVWPSAYASGALVKCRKVGAANWGNKSKNEGFSPMQVAALESAGMIEIKEGQKCWKGYEKKGTKMMFGKRYNNCVKKKTTKEEVENIDERMINVTPSAIRMKAAKSIIKKDLPKLAAGAGAVAAGVAAGNKMSKKTTNEGVQFLKREKEKKKSKSEYLGQRDAGKLAKRKMAKKDQEKVNFLEPEETNESKQVNEIFGNKFVQGLSLAGLGAGAIALNNMRRGLRKNRLKQDRFSRGRGGAMPLAIGQKQPGIKGGPVQFDYTPEGDTLNEKQLRLVKSGHAYKVVLTWRGKTYMVQMFIPSVTRPTRQEVEKQVQKLYPDAKVMSFLPRDLEPGEPTVMVDEEKRDEYGDIVGGPKISKKEKKKNLAKNEKDEDHTTTTSEETINEISPANPTRIKKPNPYSLKNKLKMAIKSVAEKERMKAGVTKEETIFEDDMKGMSVKSGHKRPTKSGAGMTAKGVAAYRRRNPGSKLKTAVTGKVKKGSKDAKRRKSYCARSAGQMKKFPKAAKDPNSRLRQARRRWKC